MIIFKQKKDFEYFLKNVLYWRGKYGGMYTPSWNSCSIYDSKETTSIKHELTHVIQQKYFLIHEKWAIEGLAELLSTAYIEDQDKEHFDLSRSYKLLRKKLKKKKSRLGLIPCISTSVKTPKNRHNYHLVATFLVANQKLKKYIQLARQGKRNGYPTLFEAVFEKPLPEINQEWAIYVNKVLDQDN